jgi:membrane-bound lytic murein transglycosylase A
LKRLFPLAFLLAGCLGPLPRRTAGGPPAKNPSAVPAAAVEPPRTNALDGHTLVPVPQDQFPSFADDGGLGDVKAAVDESLAYYRALPPDTLFLVGPERVTAARMIETLETFETLLDLDPAEFRREARRLFKVYRSPAKVTFSSYYEHTLDAALSPGGDYQFPIYGRPPDLAEEDGPRGKTMGRRENGRFVPYYSRREIDGGGVLEGKGLEIAWAADPLDIFFLQVQGSGWLRIQGEPDLLRVRFAGHNGLPYQSVGGYMIEKGILPRDKFSRKTMVAYLKNHPEERQEILAHNPRYVFFSLDHSPDAAYAFGAIRRPLTPRRSVAADKNVFAPGALAWMQTEKPRTGRFVLCQDEGGAIKGPGRIDYFVGAGKAAEDYAVAFWTPGDFYLLLLK